MSNFSPSDPPPRRDPLGFDELVAIAIALSTIGGILFWSLGRRGDEFRLTEELTPIPVPTETVTRPVVISPSPTPIEPNLPPEPRVTPPRIVTPTPRQDLPAPPVVIAPPAPGSTPVTSPSPTLDPASPTPAAPAASPQATTQTYSDVGPTFWASPFIAVLSQRGVTAAFPGPTFQPNKPLTRAEFASLLAATFPDQDQTPPITFNDIPAGAPLADAIDTAVQAGFMKGYPNGTFRPDDIIPRWQALISLSSGLGLTPPGNVDAALQVFSDANQSPEFARAAIAAATQANLVAGHPNVNQLEPNRPVTRAETAVMLHQALVQTGQVEPIPSNYIMRPTN